MSKLLEWPVATLLFFVCSFLALCLTIAFSTEPEPVATSDDSAVTFYDDEHIPGCPHCLKSTEGE